MTHISSRTDDMSDDIVAQVVADVISSPTKFSFHLDETTDFSNLSQLVVFVRYMKSNKISEEFSFCTPFTTTTKAVNVKKVMEDFFRDNDLSWNMVSAAVCSDGAPPRWDNTLVLERWGNLMHHTSLLRTVFCTGMLWQQQSCLQKLAEVLQILVECVNYVQNSAMKHRIFKELCK